MNSFFERIGHVAKVVGKDSLKVARVVAPVALQLVAPGALQSLPVLSSRITGPAAIPVNTFLFLATGVTDEMNPLEAMAISMILGVLQTSIKNPEHKAALKSHLLVLADDIYFAYGMNPPQPQA